MSDFEDTCPDSQLLIQVLDGTANADLVESVETHLGTCPDCVRRLESIGPQCLTMLSRMRRMMPDQASTSPESVPDFAEAKMQFRIRNPESIGPYRVIRKIGQGAMGEVFECHDERLHRRVAVKTLIRPDFSEDLSRRITTEARLLAGLNHPNIVTLHDFGSSEDGTPYLVMELVEGETLKRRIKKARLSANQAAYYTRDCALAIAYAHECGVLHRDLKPSNILLAKQRTTGSKADGTPVDAIAKIADFGLAKSLDVDTMDSQTGSVLGTPAYLAPEMIQKGAVVGASVDIYALGVVLYECLFGHPPFKADTFAALIKEIEHASPDFDLAESPVIPADLRTIIEKCLEKRPADHYVTARELAADLDLFLAGRPIQARPVPLSGQLVRWCRRNSLAATALAVAFLSLALIASISVGFSIRQAALRRQADKLALEASVQQNLAERSNRSAIFNQQFAKSQRDIALEILTESSDSFFAVFEILDALELKNVGAALTARIELANRIFGISNQIRQLEGFELLDTTYQMDLNGRLAIVHKALVQHQEAISEFEEALRLAETLPEPMQETGRIASRTIAWNLRIGESLTALGVPIKARTVWRNAWDRWAEKSGELARGDPEALAALVALGEKLADAEMKSGDPANSARIRKELDSMRNRASDRTSLNDSPKCDESEEADLDAY